jgi:hypothetical protein
MGNRVCAKLTTADGSNEGIDNRCGERPMLLTPYRLMLQIVDSFT